MAPLENGELLQGTLDLLILKVVALGPIHGYGISLRIRCQRKSPKRWLLRAFCA